MLGSQRQVDGFDGESTGMALILSLQTASPSQPKLWRYHFPIHRLVLVLLMLVQQPLNMMVLLLLRTHSAIKKLDLPRLAAYRSR